MTEGRHEPPSEHPSEEERVGPLLVERYRKADGRPLILYREAPREDEETDADKPRDAPRNGKAPDPGETRGDG